MHLKADIFAANQIGARRYLDLIKLRIFFKPIAMIRPAGSTDFDFVYNLYMHPQVNRYLLYEHMDAEAFRPLFDQLVQQRIKYIFSDSGEPNGMFKLVPLQHRSDHIVYLGGLAIHPFFTGGGKGMRMMGEIISLAEQQGFLRVELSVAANNEKAVRLYEKSGFHQEGILKKYTNLKSEGTFIDEIVMAYLF